MVFFTLFNLGAAPSQFLEKFRFLNILSFGCSIQGVQLACCRRLLKRHQGWTRAGPTTCIRIKSTSSGVRPYQR